MIQIILYLARCSVLHLLFTNLHLPTMDIQEILKKQQESDKQQLKVGTGGVSGVHLTLFQPKFLSKSQREAIALEKRNKEHQEKQDRMKQQQQQKEELDRRLLGASREVTLDRDTNQRDRSKRGG